MSAADDDAAALADVARPHDLSTLAGQAGIAAEVAAEAGRIEADYADRNRMAKLTIAETWWGCDNALDDAKLTRGKPEQHRYLVRLAAWAMVGLRAEVREMAAKGGEHG